MVSAKKEGRPTSLMGTSVPRIRHTSRTTWNMFGRACGFSCSIDAAILRKESAYLHSPIKHTYHFLGPICKGWIPRKLEAGVEDSHLALLLERSCVIA